MIADDNGGPEVEDIGVAHDGNDGSAWAELRIGGNGGSVTAPVGMEDTSRCGCGITTF